MSGHIRSLVIYQNQQLIAANKPCGVASLPDKTGDKSMQALMEIYCKHPLYSVHRLDRPVSGVLLFAKNKKAAAAMHQQFASRAVQKTYYALVRNKPEQDSGQLVHKLAFTEGKNTAKISEDENAKEAILDYQWLWSTENYHLLEIKPLTGRQHQIRMQLAAIGCPIKGDVKYGDKRGNKDRSIDLHAAYLQFKHPVSGQIELIHAEFPDMPIWNAVKQFLHERGK
jgi:23S rRNA pseudouridine1911/1915/1917 synthase